MRKKLLSLFLALCLLPCAAQAEDGPAQETVPEAFPAAAEPETPPAQESGEAAGDAAAVPEESEAAAAQGSGEAAGDAAAVPEESETAPAQESGEAAVEPAAPPGEPEGSEAAVEQESSEAAAPESGEAAGDTATEPEGHEAASDEESSEAAAQESSEAAGDTAAEPEGSEAASDEESGEAAGDTAAEPEGSEAAAEEQESGDAAEQHQSETAEEESSEDTWDESLCDHANEHCEQAPPCTRPDCPHIGQDVHGLDVPLCALGRWLLDRQDEAARRGASARTVRDITIDLDQADAMLYRSGAYTLIGGSRREASLTVAPGRAVVLTLRDVTLRSLGLGAGNSATVRFSGQNRIALLGAGSGTDIRFSGDGAITVDAVSLPEQDAGPVYVSGGSVRTSFTESGGRRPFVFPAAGTVRCTVNGEAYPYTCPHADGTATLWLPEPGADSAWLSDTADGILSVRLGVTTQEDSLRRPASGLHEAAAGETWLFGTDTPADAVLHIAAADVTVILQDADIRSEQIRAEQSFRLVGRGTSRVAGETLRMARVASEGSLTLDCPTGEGTAFLSGRILLACPPAGWQSEDAGDLSGCVSLSLDGVPGALLTDAAGHVLLPALPDGDAYVLAVDGQVLTAAVLHGTRSYRLSDAQASLDIADASFALSGAGNYVTGCVNVSAPAANAGLTDVQIQGAGPVLRVDGTDLSLRLSGDNGFSASGNAIELLRGATLRLDVSSGRLLLHSQSSLQGITLRGNIKVEPEPAEPHLSLMIRAKNGSPVPNTRMTVLVNGERWDVTTHFDGSLHLWGVEGEVSSVAASDGSQVYTAVVLGGSGEAVTGLTISRVRCSDREDGSVEVSWDCPGAGTAGVMYIAAPQARSLPDTWSSQARIAYGSGSVLLSGVRPGDILSLRVFACEPRGAKLTEQSADGFQFSQLLRHTHRVPFSPEEAPDTAYTGAPYVCPVRLPDGADVIYPDGSPPTDVGDYTMTVVIPEDDPLFLPGEYSVDFSILPIALTVCPEPNQMKYEGEDDPDDFFFTLEGDILPGDGEAIWILLRREEGEEAGNYAFELLEADAPDYYEISLQEDAPVFTILPGYDTEPGVWSEVLHPIKQEITRLDGRELYLMLTTTDTLTVSHTVLGFVIFGSSEYAGELFTPSLSWNRENDAVLLRLRCEPEINRDKGYATNPDGSLKWGGRHLRVSWLNVRNLERLGIDAVSMNCAGAALTVSLHELLSDGMQDFAAAHGASLADVKFRLSIEPVTSVPEDVASRRPVTDGWTVRAEMLARGQAWDITGLLTSLRCAVDMEPVAQLMRSVQRYDEDAFPGQFTLVRTAPAGSLDSTFVRPFMPGETELATWSQVLYNHRYLMTAPDDPMTVFCTRSDSR